eukprot:scaffold299513_cov49-Tisochrysis_lutea.AAC.4
MLGRLELMAAAVSAALSPVVCSNRARTRFSCVPSSTTETAAVAMRLRLRRSSSTIDAERSDGSKSPEGPPLRLPDALSHAGRRARLVPDCELDVGSGWRSGRRVGGTAPSGISAVWNGWCGWIRSAIVGFIGGVIAALRTTPRPRCPSAMTVPCSCRPGASVAPPPALASVSLLSTFATACALSPGGGGGGGGGE